MNASESEPTPADMSDGTVSTFPTWVQAVDRAHRPALLRYAWSLCRDYGRAEDAVQETFVRLCREPREKLEERLEPWLFRVCRTRIIDAVRKEGRLSPLEEATMATTADTGTADPAQETERHDTHVHLLAHIDRLPPAQREVVRLKFQNHLSYQEIAEVTHKTVNTVGVLLHTAMQSLRRTLANDPELRREENHPHER